MEFPIFFFFEFCCSYTLGIESLKISYLLFQELKVYKDDVVWAKHKNGRYYKGIVIKVEVQDFYKVEFTIDGSTSEDIDPKDVLVSTHSSLLVSFYSNLILLF